MEHLEFKGTQGEWGCSEIMNFSGTLVSYINTSVKEIAQLRGCVSGEEEEALANAKLIAAAPDLLKALQDLLDVDEVDVHSLFKVQQNAHKAINKALK
jgi:hypothetical protein